MTSEYTKINKRKMWLYRIIDFIILFAPIVVYVFIAFFGEGLTASKVGLAGCVVIALVLVIFNVIAQKRLRCPIWIILIGLFLVMKQYLLPLILMLAAGSILDDLLLTPLIDYYRNKAIAHKAIDEREEDGAN